MVCGLDHSGSQPFNYYIEVGNERKWNIDVVIIPVHS